MTERDQQLIRALQEGLPLVERPYAEIGRRAGWSEADVLARLRQWKQAGILRRICAYLRHRQAGYLANGLVVWDVPEERLPEVGARIAASPRVSHCYARRRDEKFPYRLYTMLHGRSRDDVRHDVQRLAQAEGIDRYRILFSTRELKRSTPRLFAEE